MDFIVVLHLIITLIEMNHSHANYQESVPYEISGIRHDSYFYSLIVLLSNVSFSKFCVSY